MNTPTKGTAPKKHTALRLTDDDLALLAAAAKRYSRPGLRVTRSDAFRILLRAGAVAEGITDKAAP